MHTFLIYIYIYNKVIIFIEYTIVVRFNFNRVHKYRFKDTMYSNFNNLLQLINSFI
jgi:hypothetical protein